MALRDWIGDSNGVATATVATTATVDLQIRGSVAKVATVSVATPPQKSANPLLDPNRKPGMNYISTTTIDREAFEERAAIREFDGGFRRQEAECGSPTMIFAQGWGRNGKGDNYGGSARA